MYITDINEPLKLLKSEGLPSATIMIVGDMPTYADVNQGRSFTGYAGKILDEALVSCGISRSDIYITNVIKQAGTMETFIKFPNKGEPVCSAIYATYVKMLADEIVSVNPNVIIAVGPVALFTLTEKIGILKYRGSLLPCTLVEGKKVIPTLNPSMAIRDYQYKYLIRQDFVKAKRQSAFPDLVYQERNYILEPSYQQAIDFLEKMKSAPSHAFDIEVANQEMSCISFAIDSKEAISIPFLYGNNLNYWNPQQEMEIFRRIAALLGDPDKMSIAHNTSFDSTFLFRKYNIVPRNLHDTMIAHAILLPEFPKGLDFITTSYTDIPYYKDDGKDIIKGKRIGSDREFWLYNAKDSIVVAEAFPKIISELERQKNIDTYHRQRAMLQPILFMTEYGIKMDVAGMRSKSLELKDANDELYEKLIELSGKDLNPNSSKQLISYFYEEKGIRPYKSKSGSITADSSALKRMSRAGHKEAQIIMDMRKNKKLDSTYMNMLLDPDNRLRSSMNPVGTRYGRLSSSKTIFGTGGNVQNIPPAMKKYLLIDDGFVGYDIDLSQAENRIVAYIGPDQNMISAFEQGIDIHSKTASLVFNKPVELISKEKGSTSIGNGKFSERDIGKVSNHSLNYMMGYKSFAYHWEISEIDGKRIRDAYIKNYPGVVKMWQWIEDEIRKTRTLTNLMGRKCLFLDRFGDELLKEACAFTPQSTVADKINQHGILFIYERQDLFPEVVLLNQVHDSVVIQIPKNVGWKRHAEILLAIKKSLETPLSFRGREFVIPADIQILPFNFKEGPELDRKKITGDIDAFAEMLQTEYDKFVSEYGQK